MPKNITDRKSFYVYEEIPINKNKISFGGRVEEVAMDSEGGGRFGAQVSRNFTPTSLAIGGLYTINENWSLTSNLSHNERAPSYFELFADGPHLATGQYEVGNVNLGKERSNGLDAQIRWKQNKHSFNLGVYYTHFDNFISLSNSANLRGLDGELNPVDLNNDGVADISGAEILPEAIFSAVPAGFTGIEAEGKFRIYDELGSLDLKVRGDYVHATNSNTGRFLPRIAPIRLGMELDYKLDRFGARLDILHGFKQDKTDEFELPTNSYTSINTTFTYLIPTKYQLEAYLKINNLLNEEIRDHSSFLKEIAPQGGRSALIGLRGEF